jgi:transposase
MPRRPGAGPRRRFPSVERAFADAARAAGRVAGRVAGATRLAVEIVRKPKGRVGFAVQPRRWVIERCVARPGRNRRPAKDFAAAIASATASLYAASVLLLSRRIARRA